MTLQDCYWMPETPSPAVCPPLPAGYRLPLLSEPDVVAVGGMWLSYRGWMLSDRYQVGCTYRHYCHLWHCVPIPDAENDSDKPQTWTRQRRRKLEF